MVHAVPDNAVDGTARSPFGEYLRPNTSAGVGLEPVDRVVVSTLENFPAACQKETAFACVIVCASVWVVATARAALLVDFHQTRLERLEREAWATECDVLFVCRERSQVMLRVI